MSSSPEPTIKKPFNFKRLLGQAMAIGVSLIVLGIITLAFHLFHLNRMVEQLELKTYDLRTQSQWNNLDRRPSSDIVILAFDDTSLNALSDEFGLWPWPRDVHARMIRFLNKLGVRNLLYDVMFVSSRRDNPQGDIALSNVFRQYKNVYLSMNLDHEMEQSKKLGKDLTPHDLDLLRPLSIEVRNELAKAPKDTILQLYRDEDGTVFFANHNMTFNHYRSVMKSLLAVGRNIAIINHGSDEDGVSRANPLFFRFVYKPFIKTTALPLHTKNGNFYDADGNRTDAQGYRLQRSSYLPVVRQNHPLNAKDIVSYYLDRNPQSPQPVDAEGYLNDGYGHPVYMRGAHNQALFFPYLGLRAMLDLTYPPNASAQKPSLLITPEGHLKIATLDIPLRPDGSYLATWYNVSVQREELEKEQALIEAYISSLTSSIQHLQGALDGAGQSTAFFKKSKKIRQDLLIQQVALLRAEASQNEISQRLKLPFVPQPYRTVPAWEVIRAMRRSEAGLPPTVEDRKLAAFLKNKMIFIGATAIAAYDIKNTPISALMPGIILQATVFDNLLHNASPPSAGRQNIERVPPYINFWLTVGLSLLALLVNLRLRSTLMAVLGTANLIVLYVLVGIIVYQHLNLWIDLVVPLAILIITTLLSFIVKYILRNKDYEETYALATTDSMTGLYNHRFFQESIRQSIEQSNRYGHPFSLLLIDIDFFKKFNDNYGHQAGDAVLRHVAVQLKKTVRSVDVVARYGGEEMAIILARSGQEEALQIADKVVKAIASEAYPIADGVSKHVTISCGVAVYPQHGSTAPQLIEIADGGLYRAKDNGRNQVGAIPEQAEVSEQTTEQKPVVP
jgi:diguanylate cyclase (GGDEF)-like protein